MQNKYLTLSDMALAGYAPLWLGGITWFLGKYKSFSLIPKSLVIRSLFVLFDPLVLQAYKFA